MLESGKSIFNEMTIVIEAAIHVVVTFQGIVFSWNHSISSLLRDLVPMIFAILALVSNNPFS